MNNKLNDDQVRRKIPVGCKLPNRFDDFLRDQPPIPVEWNDLEAYGLRPTAMKEAVPFLRLPDGAVVAFWYHSPSPAIVLIGGHGESKVIAQDFDNFLKGIGARCSGLLEFDESKRAFCVPGIAGKPMTDRVPSLQEKFEAWIKKRASLQEPLAGKAAEELRQRVHRVVVEMICDGLSKVYTPSSPWWSMSFQIERNDSRLSISYLDYGKWYPVPEKYNLVQEVMALVNLAKEKTLLRYLLTVSSAGIVSLNRDQELVLVPAKKGVTH